jgi:signal transduction histidine kinase
VLSLKLNNNTDKLIFDVIDSGVGFPDDGRQRLFSVFSQLDNTRGGVGLGLVLAKQLSRELRGIWSLFQAGRAAARTSELSWM